MKPYLVLVLRSVCAQQNGVGWVHQRDSARVKSRETFHQSLIDPFQVFYLLCTFRRDKDHLVAYLNITFHIQSIRIYKYAGWINKLIDKEC